MDIITEALWGSFLGTETLRHAKTFLYALLGNHSETAGSGPNHTVQNLKHAPLLQGDQG